MSASPDRESQMGQPAPIEPMPASKPRRAPSGPEIRPGGMSLLQILEHAEDYARVAAGQTSNLGAHQQLSKVRRALEWLIPYARVHGL